MQRYFKLLIVMICLALVFSTMYAVKKTKGKTTPVPEVKIPREEILAEYTNGMITKKDLQDKIAKLPPQNQGRFKTIEGQTQLLDIIIVEDVFYLKSKEMKLQSDPVIMDKIESAKKQVLTQEYYNRNVKNKVNLTEAEKQEYYRNNEKAFYEQPYVTILYIQPADSAAAIIALADLEKGVPFKKVSTDYSINTYAKSIEGKIKNIRGNGYLPGIGNDTELDGIILNAPVDTINYLGPLKTSSGWSIIQIIERIEGKQKTYLESEPEVDQRLRPIRESELLDRIVDAQKKIYKVVIDTTSLANVNLMEPEKNSEIMDKVIVASPEPTLVMNVSQLLEKFQKISPQEQMSYKSAGALMMVNQDLNRNLMYLDALKDKSLLEYLDNNEDYNQTKRYYVLQEAYKRLVLDSLSVTPEDVSAYYNSHLQDFTSKPSRKVTAVWCKDDKTAAKARKAMIKAVKKNNAKAIAKVLKQYNLKPEQETLDNNYQNGVVTGIGADKKLSELIWSTAVGSVSEISKTSKNEVIFFHVIEEHPPVTQSLSETESRIQNQLKREKANIRMEEVKQQLFTQYNLKKYPEKLEIKLTAEELFEMADGSARQRKFKDATIYYDQIIKFYPNRSDDYKASFMKAFLITEEMGDKEQGLMLFQEFLKKYPTGELNESAQYMIDELQGKHPVFEEIEPEEE